ncbi:hypothetical protein Tco_1465182 [Tanacetum coccineum]
MVAYLKKPTGSEGFQEIVNFLNGSHIRTVDNGEQEINAIVDGKEFTITEASVRRHLQLADVDGISVLPNTKIFDQLTLMGYVLTDDKLTFQKVCWHFKQNEGEGSEIHFDPQTPPSMLNLLYEEPILILNHRHTKDSSPRQALNKDIELPQTSVPIPYVTDEAACHTSPRRKRKA